MSSDMSKVGQDADAAVPEITTTPPPIAVTPPMDRSTSFVNETQFLDEGKSPTYTYRQRACDLPPPVVLVDEMKQYQRINISAVQSEMPAETVEGAKRIMTALNLRHKYVTYERKNPFDEDPAECFTFETNPHDPPKTPKTDEIMRMRDGVMRVYSSQEDLFQENPMFDCITLQNFYRDVKEILECAAHGPSKSMAFRRLELLEAKFQLHSQLNHDLESAEQQKVSHRDFYNVRKVDNHVHLSACMNQKHLLRHIKSVVKREPQQVVKIRDGKEMTIEDVFRELNLTPYDLSIDHLNMHADANTFHRFDRFNLKYNPCGESLLREIFLKTDNLVGGRYMATVCKQVFTDLEESKYQMAEYRVSIYGRNPDEWTNLAKWVVKHDLFSPNVRWMIQVPRLFNVFRETGQVNSFQDLLNNLFVPLFEATRDPEAHPEIHKFLQHIVGFDSVDDESRPEHKMFHKYPRPSDWDIEKNPPYTYYIFFMWANLHVLNKYRKMKGLNMITIRPHCGESGDPDHLAAGFLVSQSIAHGIQLRKHPVLEYLFYLSQIGISMSPLSNNKLFLRYEKNPFPKYFARGLNVTLSTDDPLLIHLTREPLVEEYSIASQVYRLSNMDICEIARNSVLMSGFENHVKAQWNGENWRKPFSEGNDTSKTNVPTIRTHFRESTMKDEWEFLQSMQ